MKFKILNFFRLGCQNDPERFESMQEYDGEYNYELNNEYFENIWFRSDLELSLIEFQIFFTMYEYLRLPGLFLNPKHIQSYYLKKYQTPFFHELLTPEQGENFQPATKLNKILTYNDFKEIIRPALKLNLTDQIEEAKLESKFYIFNNWEFYTELQTGQLSNSLLRYIHSIPGGTKNSYENEQKARLQAINTLLENASTTVDTQLKGLNFRLNHDTNLFSQESYANNFWLVPKVRRIRVQNEFPEKTQVIINEFDLLFSDKSLKPFEIFHGR